MRSASRAANQRSDIKRAEAEVDEIEQDIKDLEATLESAVKEITEEYSADEIEVKPYEIKPRKSDIAAEPVALVWAPYQITADGIAEPAFDK